jgi:hypothetical protein
MYESVLLLTVIEINTKTNYFIELCIGGAYIKSVGLYNIS